MNQELRKLYDEKGKIVSQMQQLGDKVKRGDKPKLDEEDRAQLRKWDEELKSISKQIEDHEILARAAAEQIVKQENEITKRELEEKKEVKFADFRGLKEAEIAERRSEVWNKAQKNGLSSLDEEERSVYNVVDRDNKIYRKWLRKGEKGLNAEERQILEARALSHVTEASGAYTIPEGFAGYIIERLKFISQINEWAMTQSTATGNDIPYPTNDDTSNVGELLAENTEAGEQDMSFGQIIAKAFVFSTKYMRVPNQLIQDNGVNLEEYIARQFALRVARIENQYFTTGSGTSQPQGYVTGATQGVVSASASAFTADELMQLEHSLDIAYRSNRNRVAWAMHDSIILEIKKLSVTTNPIKPIWIPSLSSGQPDTILGYRYFINNDMASSLTSGAKPIVLGDWDSFLIRRVNGFALQRLVELHALYNQTTFVGFSRSDSRVLQPNGLKYLEMT